MDILDLQKALNRLRELLMKDDKIKQQGVAGPGGFQANPEQLTPVDESKIKHIPAEKSPGYDRTLASRASIPLSNKEPPKEEKKSVLDTRPVGPVHKLGVWDKLGKDHQHHLMNTMKPGDRDMLNSILDARDRGGASHEELVGATQKFIDSKTQKIEAAKSAKTKAKPQKEMSAEELEGIRESVKRENDPPIDLSHIPLKGLYATKKFIQERASKKSKFYHKAFDADGQYTKQQTIQALHDWAHGKPLPKEVTSSTAFKTVSSRFYEPTAPAEPEKKVTAKYVAGKDGMQRTMGTAAPETADETPKKEFAPKTISLDD